MCMVYGLGKRVKYILRVNKKCTKCQMTLTLNIGHVK